MGATSAAGSEASPFEGTAYREVERLGGGGMGDVYLVEHRETGRRRVAKVVREKHASDPQFLDRARLEIEALGRLRHTNIVRALGAESTADGRPFLVLERLTGCTLAQELELRGGFLPVGEALAITAQILSALSATHELGLVHRDVKPSNVFVCQRVAGAPLVKLLDFGIARVTPDAPPDAPDPLALPTESGAVVGTPRYTSPEGAKGDRVDQRADLYAVALVLYKMVAGRGPFDHAGPHEVLAAHASEQPAPPSRYASVPVAAELDQLVLRALAKDPEGRFQTAEDFRFAVEEVPRRHQSPQGWLENTAFERVTSDANGAGEMNEPELRRPRAGNLWSLVLLCLVTALVATLVGAALTALFEGRGGLD